jgi:hypothetical protein
MVQSTRSPSLADVAREVLMDARRPLMHEPLSAHTNPPTVRAPDLAMPDYVEHRNGATEIGRLSAEAVVREYEATAKEIESMGGELLARVKQCEDVTRDAFAVTEELNQIARRYREEAKRVFEHIEGCSSMVAEVRNICSELKDKIAAPLAANGQKQKGK